MPRRLAAALPLVAAAALVPALRPADACCPAFPEAQPVAIADQEVLIAYDPETQVEHFVRQAAFQSRAEEGFGFLVPTPTQPELAEAPGELFARLREQIRPRIETVTRRTFTLGSIFGIAHDLAPTAAAPRAKAAALEPTVRVLDRARVAGYDAVVLEADDATALTAWLGEHGYTARPELLEWVTPYVEAGWKVTAFRYAADAPAPEGVSTAAVRLTFKTDRPLFPYRVPTDQLAPKGQGNTLRLYYVGPERAEGTLGSGAVWNAEIKYAAALEDAGQLLAGALPDASACEGRWLTAFEDHTWPSGTDDLYFGESPDPTPYVPVITREVEEEVVIPIEVLAALLIGGVFLGRKLRGPRKPPQ